MSQAEADLNYAGQLEAEAASWLIADKYERREKFQRERIRHHKLVRDLLLHELPTHTMMILEVGGGPMPVSDLLQFESRTVIDPLTKEYRTVLPCLDHLEMCVEDLDEVNAYDLVIATNSLDHVHSPELALHRMFEALRPGGFMAIMCAQNNAITNPHPAHVHNLSAEWVHRQLDFTCETVWELNFHEHNYRYGWAEYEGRRGQPAFAILMRNCFGY